MVLGYGESADAHHLTQPHPQGVGAGRAMRAALESAGLTLADIDLVAAHATGTPDNDASEFAALSGLFGANLPRVPVVAFKSHLGHTLGGAGAVELILSAKGIEQQIIPACANIAAEEVEFAGLNVATGRPRPAQIRATLNTSLGFGGANTCLVLGRPPELARLREGEAPAEPNLRSIARPAQREVFISGIGVLLPGAIGNEAFIRKLTSGSDTVAGEIPESEFAPLLNARRIRRMSQYVKLSLAAAMLCLRDAGIDDIALYADSCAALLGTTHGSSGYCEQYYHQIVSEGISAANPMLFAEGVPNAAAAHLSLMLSLRGPCQTVIGSRTAGLDAIRLAAARIASGEWERALVGAAEEFSLTVNAAHARQRAAGPEGFVVSSGAVTLLLESRPAMESRGGRARGRVDAASGGIARGASLARLVRRTILAIGSPPVLFGSANGSWTDRAERAGAAHASERFVASTACAAECYSVVPLAALAGALLSGRPGALGALATDPAGAVSAVSFSR
jgi:3-oxoacyl-[acyl-carrier-protein] synthase II